MVGLDDEYVYINDPFFQDAPLEVEIDHFLAAWRRITIPATASLDAFSSSILAAFRFDNDHLYRFTYQNRFGSEEHINHPYLEERPFTSEVRIGDLPIAVGATMIYLFDFGDHWEFSVTLEGIDPPDPRPKRAQVIESYGEAPEQYPNVGDEGDWDEEWEEVEE